MEQVMISTTGDSEEKDPRNQPPPPLPPQRLKLASLEAAGRNLHFLVRHAVETFSHENNNHNQCHASHGNIRDWTGLLNPGGSL